MTVRIHKYLIEFKNYFAYKILRKYDHQLWDLSTNVKEPFCPMNPRPDAVQHAYCIEIENELVCNVCFLQVHHLFEVQFWLHEYYSIIENSNDCNIWWKSVRWKWDKIRLQVLTQTHEQQTKINDAWLIAKRDSNIKGHCNILVFISKCHHIKRFGYVQKNSGLNHIFSDVLHRFVEGRRGVFTLHLFPCLSIQRICF